jgi:FixJ family two-component response regulator
MAQERFKALNILVVDDESEIRELLGEYLSARGHVVRTATDGRVALALLDEAPADVMLTDVRMPVIEGVELVESVGERGLPMGIVVMTGFPTIDSVTSAMKMGASDYLLKPFRLREVYRALMTAASRSLVERRLDRLQRTGDFYEACNDALSSDDLPALHPLLLAAAQGEVRCDAAALWTRKPGGDWSLSEAAASHPALDVLRPEDIQAPRHEADLLAVPIIVRTRRASILAVAGSAVGAPEHLDRLQHLTRALALTIERITAP